jgi:hypothetical protein
MVNKSIKNVNVYPSEEIDSLLGQARDSKNDFVVLIPTERKGQLRAVKARIDGNYDIDQKVKNAKTWQLIMLVLTAIGTGLTIWFSTIEGGFVYTFIAFILTLWCLFLAIFFLMRPRILRQTEAKKGFWGSLTKETQRALLLTIITIALAITLVVIAYKFEISDWILTVSIIAILEARLIVSVFEKLHELKEKPDEKFSKANFIAQNIIMIALVGFALPMLTGLNFFASFESETFVAVNMQFNICMILVALSGIIGIMQLNRVKEVVKGNTTVRIGVEDLDYDHTSLPRYIVMIIVPMLTMLVYPITGSIIENQMFSGALGDYDYFNAVYVSIVGSKYTQFSTVLIVLSGFIIIIGKAQGKRGSSTMVIGALGLAGVPMLITIMAFIGQIPAPPQFYELFGEGFAELVYAISYTSVIAIILSLVGIFYEIVPSSSDYVLDD